MRLLIFSFLYFFCFLVNHGLAKTQKIMIFGDSLVAGFGLMREDSFPSQLEKKLLSENYDIKIINAGVSGETTAGGLARLEWTISDSPDALILILGGNDMLRGIPTKNIKKNLSQMLKILNQKNIEVLLAGMLSTDNFGKNYRDSFDSIYPSLSAKYDVVFYPFFLENVALVPWFNQNDGLHPNKDGVKLIVSQIMPFVRTLINRINENSHQ